MPREFHPPHPFINSRLTRQTVCALAVSLLTCGTGADDIEIYTYPDVTPSVLFIMDTSGSMSSDVYIPVDYNPQTDYSLMVPEGIAACRHDRLYWSHGNTLLSCDSGSRHLFFDKSSNRCNASWTALDMDNAAPGPDSDPGSQGYYSNRWTRHDSDKKNWFPFDARHHDAPYYTHVECRSDQVIEPYHGEGTGDGAPHITPGVPPYKTSLSDFSWDDVSGRSGSYTVYTGNWLNYTFFNSSHRLGTRMEVVKDALQDLITNVPAINAGLMEFGVHEGGAVTSAIARLGAAGSQSRQSLVDQVESMQPYGLTPLAETLHEAYRYWTGGEIEYGNKDLISDAASRNPASLSSGVYASPFKADCSQNYQVLLTDGQPRSDSSSDPEIRELISIANSNNAWLFPSLIATSSCEYSYDNSYGSCLDDLAELMNKTDLSTGDDPNINHTVTTYTIGFDISSNVSARWLLERTAEHGGGKFFEASDSASLVNAFQETIAGILEKNASFSPPSISVNTLNRLVHNDELYFALFEPGDSSHWPGNIKRYRLEFVTSDLDGNGSVEHDEGEYEIVDVNGDNAIDPETVQIEDSAESWWNLSSEADGNAVNAGGLAHRLFDWDFESESFMSSSRAGKVFTYVEDFDFNDFDGSGISLINLHEDNTAINVDDEGLPEKPIKREHFGLAGNYGNDDFLKLVKWSRGVDTFDSDFDGNNTEGRPQYGAPLHAKPVVVTYETDHENDTQKNVVFSITNDGYFHGARTSEPSERGRMEYFAFVPGPLLKNLESLAENDITVPVYGLDGGLTIWRRDVDNDGTIEAADGDHVIAYFGQRRGGRAVFAVDVTTLTRPELLWVINPDNPEQADDERFTYLGQSWAAPQRTKMLVGDEDHLALRDVVVISGGYDADLQDSAGAARIETGDERGHAIYIVDAFTGELYWWASKTDSKDPGDIKFDSDDMKWGFPASARLVDINGDDVVDMMFSADSGGQVWRFDIKNQLLKSDSKFLVDRITGGVIADFQKVDAAAELTAPNNRRFYYSPDIALMGIGESPNLTIALGSGYRAHPLDEDIDDRFYLIKDYDITGPPLGEDGDIAYTVLYESDLLDITDINLADEDTTLNLNQQNLLEQGWMLDLADNEKVLATSITMAGNVIFTTYTPPDVRFDAATCTANIGTGAAYIVRIDDARPVYDLTAVFNGDLTIEDRKQALHARGIPADPLPVYTEGPTGNEAVVLVGKESLPVKFSSAPNLSYWYRHGIR